MERCQTEYALTMMRVPARHALYAIMMHWRKAVEAAFVPLGVSALMAACWAWSIEIQVAAYDDAYRRVAVGRAADEAVVLLGAPHAVDIPQSQLFRIVRFYKYRIDRPLRAPVRWTLGIDANGAVVSKHRDANGC
jgi:hypothetical protein